MLSMQWEHLSVGPRALTVKQAILIAMIFEFAGIYLTGGEVTSTIRKGIIDASLLSGATEYLVFDMLSALLACRYLVTVSQPVLVCQSQQHILRRSRL